MDRWYLLEVSKYSNSLVFLALYQVSKYASNKKGEVHDFLRTPKTTGGKERRSGTEKRCSHNLQSAHLGQRRICDLTAGLFSEVE